MATVLAALAAAICLSSCSSPASDHDTHPTSKDQPLVSGEPAGFNAQDVAFANAMVQNHKQGIDLSTLVPDHSTNPKVIAFAAGRASALQSDNAVLKVMLVQWNENPSANTGGGGGATATTGLVDQATIAKLDSLRGGTFDTLWLQSMDAIGLARQIVDTRQADIGKMKQLLGS